MKAARSTPPARAWGLVQDGEDGPGGAASDKITSGNYPGDPEKLSNLGGCR